MLSRWAARSLVRFAVFAAFLAIGLINSAYALDPNHAMSQYLRDHWGPEQGFPRGPVYAISQTPDGYLWVGTGEGLFRFDGFSFLPIRDHSGKFAITDVLGLAPDNDGCLWLRSGDLTLLRYCHGQFDGPAPATQNVIASAMSRTNKGELLAAQSPKSAFTFRNGGFRTLASVNDPSPSTATALTQMPNGEIWMGTLDEGIFRLADSKTSAANWLPNTKINCLLSDGDHGIWAGTDDGIFRWDGHAFVAVDMSPTGHFQALSMSRDRDGNLWVGTNSRGLFRINSLGVANLDQNVANEANESDSDSGKAITAVFEDREGNLWVGGAGGLDRLRDSTFVTYSAAEGVPGNGSNPVFADADNTVWFPALNGGLWWLKDGRHGRIGDPGLDKDVIYSVAGRSGELWLGRQRGGLSVVHTGKVPVTVKSYTESDGLAQNSVYSVYPARDGSIWAGTLSGGVSRLTDGKFTTYTAANGLASDTVVSILETADGTLWFATPSGLSALSGGHWQTYTSNDGLPSTNVNCLMEDSHGVLWTGTTAGLGFRDAAGFHRMKEVHLSLQEQFLGLAEDKFGWFWISTSGHLLRVKRDALVRGIVAEQDVREFGIADGLRGVAGVKRNRTVVTDPRGRIWFSLNRGISSVDPARLARNSVPAIPHLLAISADENAIAQAPSVHIPGGSKRVMFSFIGLNLAAPDGVRFRYQLDGYDHGWSQPSATRETGYTNLSPGPYRFRLIASNADGVWSGSEATVQFQVDPLYWQTSWFRFVVVLTCTLVIAAMWRMRLHQLTSQLNGRFDERLAERTRIARDLHDTLLQSFQGLMLRLQVVDDLLPDGRAKQELELSLERADQAIAEGRSAVHDLRLSAIATNDLVQAMRAIGDELAVEDAAAFRLVAEGTARELHPIVRDEIYRIAREALRNAFSHARAQHIEVEITSAERLFRMRIRDDGDGIAPGIVEGGRPGHYGLTGMRERAEQIGAEFSIWSGTNAGTEIDLSIAGPIAYRKSPGRPRLRLFRKEVS